MSKIAEQLATPFNHKATMSVDTIFENSTINDIKDYILYLQNENMSKDKQVRELVEQNLKMEIALEKSKHSLNILRYG
ncbi:hypothetical protein MZM54_00485 [[Brevibacterium] frigoritolerans]|nr:hypothetical protein [Peribacillus frigoritolerans]